MPDGLSLDRIALDSNGLRAALGRTLLTTPETSPPVFEDGAEHTVLTPAAVLVPVVIYGREPAIVFTKRTSHLRDHAGQISFPGGRTEAGDESPVDTALREAQEEIGLPRGAVEVVGFLPEYRTGTGFAVTPVVGMLSAAVSYSPDPFEVEEIFEVPLGFLLDPKNHQRHTMEYRGSLRTYYAMPFGERFIWGATAGILRTLYERLRRELDPASSSGPRFQG